MLENRKEKKLLTTKEVADTLKYDVSHFREIAKKVLPNKIFKNGKQTFFNEVEVVKVKDYIEKTGQVSTYANLAQVTTKNENLIKAIEPIKNLTLEEQIKLSFSMQADIIKKLTETNIQITEKYIDTSNELNEFKNLETEKYKSKELRAKINRKLRDIAKNNFGNNFKDAWSFFYIKYADSHCFKGMQNLDVIQERGHLKEFYGLLLNF
jgi:hypothetical protein